MIKPSENPNGIASPNRRFAVAAEGFRGRAGLWFWRLLGQVRRQYLSRLRPAYARRARQFRRGECRQCGACCDLTFHCPYLSEQRRCTHYEKRQITCRQFPHDALDLRLTRVPCGHYFDPMPEAPPCRVPFTRYGLRELFLFSGLAAAGIVLSATFFPYVVPLFALGLGFVLFFFRDPHRRIPSTPGVLVAPADGKIVEVCETDEPRFLKERAHKIGIFMSPVDVHVNRSPCAGRVEAVSHQPGRFRNAMSGAASDQNESNAVLIGDADNGRTRLLVRQVAGVMARRIVCEAEVGGRLARGQRFGMVKFGSRLEVYVPAASGFDVTVRLGQRVKAGESILGTFR